MTRDIKAVVAELERQNAKREFSYDTIKLGEALVDAFPSLLAELRRLWAIEEAAVALREANEAYQELRVSADMAAVNYARQRDSESRVDLFAALPPRKPSGGEEAKP